MRKKSLAEEPFVPIYDFGAERVDEILSLFADAWWATGRTKEQVLDMLSVPQALVGLEPKGGGSLVGFARALYDNQYKAIVEDVIVSEALRNQGLGHLLMDALLAHPVVSRVEEVELYCHPDRLRFYSDAGFSVVDDQLFMRRPGLRYQGSTDSDGIEKQ